jgi:hypothetical protein
LPNIFHSFFLWGKGNKEKLKEVSGDFNQIIPTDAAKRQRVTAQPKGKSAL